MSEDKPQEPTRRVTPVLPALDYQGDCLVVEDYDAAIYLFAANLPIVAATYLGESKRQFIFRDKERQAESKLLEFLNGASTLQPVQIMNAQRRLKTLLHAFRSSNRSKKEYNNNARPRTR